ncbi:MAG TPA: ATP-binding protein [Ktedonobacteraceae bacterium]|nr:ATP-binding protein [Ktedonobacteraceae bacterium]
MSWSQQRHAEDLYEQMVILVGSAVRLLRGQAGVFVLANAAFDPQSSSEYTFYQLRETEARFFLASLRERAQPGPARPLVIDQLPPALTAQLDGEPFTGAAATAPALERRSFYVADAAGALGVLHCLVLASLAPGAPSTGEVAGAPLAEADQQIVLAQLAAGLRSTLRAQSLVKEQQRLTAIFHQSAEGILSVDAALRILDFNPAMERLTGWREYEVVGRFYAEVLRPKDRQGHDLGLQGSPILQALAGQRVVDREMIIVARDGQQFTASVNASCIYSAHGEPTIGILTVRDISRELEQEEQRSTFISVISHELQTPIAIIKGYASTLARSDAVLNPEALRTRLKAIEEEADRLNKLVGNLLYASRIQAGGLQMDVTPLDLTPLIERVAERLHVKNADATITLNLPAHLPTVMADRERIEEVLQNLLDNAIKYSPGKAQITVTCRITGDEVIVSISDQGMGIALREQEEIFDRFQRAGNSKSSAIQGAGLGLYICRAIVEAHGGRIWVESTLHSGSTFSFSLLREEKAQLPMVVF